MAFTNTGISRAIIESYSKKLTGALESDVLVAGAGPSGLVAAWLLAREGLNDTVVEKKLSTGGGIWGGGMTMNDVVVQEDAREILEELEIRTRDAGDGTFLVDAVEFASGLTYRAVRAGARILNVVVIEDVAVQKGRLSGLVVNRTTVYGTLHVDPLVLAGKVTIDATGHDAAVVAALRKHGARLETPGGEPVGEGPMDAPEGERFVVEHTGKIFPGLLVSGMAVCAVFGGPRMGPIFGGMLLSGKKVAQLALDEVKAAR